jgi:hypothetical protein
VVFDRSGVQPMIDDPFALLMYGIAAMAGGMYPLGLLFGACSACCDECPEECDKCSQYYVLDGNGLRCSDPPDSVVVASEYASKTYALQGDSLIANGVQHVQLTEEFDCPSNIRVYLAFGFSAFATGAALDQCGCGQCLYELEYQLGIGERGTFGGQPYDEFLETTRISPPRLVPTYDKCLQTTKEIEVTVTSAEVLEVYSGLGDFESACPGVETFFSDIEDFTITIGIHYDDPCECGACCRESTCTENETEGYCEQNTGVWNDLGNGSWQGVGTDCDPNPCVEE